MDARAASGGGLLNDIVKGYDVEICILLCRVKEAIIDMKRIRDLNP